MTHAGWREVVSVSLLMERVLVAGASGLIGGHLVKRLLAEGHQVRAVGRRPFSEWSQLHAAAENLQLDLREKEHCYRAVEGVVAVYNLAADIGGVRYIESKRAELMLSVLINTHLLMASRGLGIKRYFYSSTYAVSAADHEPAGVLGDGHIWEKLFSEKLCQYFREDYGIQTRVARLQNVYGPYECYGDERERVTAAMCRKAIEAKRSGNYEFEIWGDGTQTRNFLYVDDAVAGIVELMASDREEPVVLGSSEFRTINELVDVVEEIAGIKFERRHNLSAPVGTPRRPGPLPGHPRLDWAPHVSLRHGMERLYRWMEQDMERKSGERT